MFLSVFATYIESKCKLKFWNSYNVTIGENFYLFSMLTIAPHMSSPTSVYLSSLSSSIQIPLIPPVPHTLLIPPSGQHTPARSLTGVRRGAGQISLDRGQHVRGERLPGLNGDNFTPKCLWLTVLSSPRVSCFKLILNIGALHMFSLNQPLGIGP